MATFWILRVFFHTLSTKTSHKTTFKLIGNVRIALVDKLSRLPLGTGTVNITSGDDGINISGDNPQGFTITGGAVTIDSEGDGLDSNAAGTISGAARHGSAKKPARQLTPVNTGSLMA